MPGHKHDSSAGTQNQGNTLGDRACVRQSKLYRMHESGNDIKSILGTPHLCWDTRQKQGAYEGQAVYDHTVGNPYGMDSKYQQNRRKSLEPHGAGGAPFARGDSYSDSQTYATTSGGYGSRKGNDSYDYEEESGYGGYSAPSNTKYSSGKPNGQSTAYRTGLGGEDYGSSASSHQTSLGQYSQATRRSKQLQDLPPNPYAKRDNDENVRDGYNCSYEGAGNYPISKMGNDNYSSNSRLSQMREMKEQMDTSSYRGVRGGGNSMALSAYAGNGRSAGKDDRSTRPW